MRKLPCGFTDYNEWTRRCFATHEAAHVVIAALTPNSVIGPIITTASGMDTVLRVEDNRHVALAGYLATAPLYEQKPMPFLRLAMRTESARDEDFQRLRPLHLTDAEVREAARECLEMIEEHRDAIEAIANALYVKRALSHSEIEALLAYAGVGLAPGVTFSPLR